MPRNRVLETSVLEIFPGDAPGPPTHTFPASLVVFRPLVFTTVSVDVSSRLYFTPKREHDHDDMDSIHENLFHWIYMMVFHVKFDEKCFINSYIFPIFFKKIWDISYIILANMWWEPCNKMAIVKDLCCDNIWGRS